MRRFAWFRLLIPGLCAGLIPACLSPAPSPFVRSAKPYTVDPNRSNAFAPTPPIARPLPPEPPLFRSTEWVTTGDLPPLTLGASLCGMPLRPRDDVPTPGKTAQYLLMSVREQRVAEKISTGAPGKLPNSITGESPMVTALKYYIEKDPESAKKELSKLDDTSRDILLTLLPLTVRVGSNGLAKSDPQEIALVVDRLQGLLWALRPKAALVMDKCCFCREIRRFGVFEALDGKATFQPGEMVEVYAEVRNVASELHRSKRGDYRTHLRSSLDIRRAVGDVAWSGKQFDKPDDTLTPQHDYFQHYRLQVPQLGPGPYVLHLEVTDVPTGRTVARELEFTIAPTGGPAQSE
jgi:hypothetical protein